MKYLFKVENPSSAVKLTEQQSDIILRELQLTEEELKTRHAIRGYLKTHGPWQIPVSYRALCITKLYEEQPYAICSPKIVGMVVFGVRTMNRAREAGTVLEGRVSVSGKDYSCFSSHELLTFANGHLADVATIFARVPDRVLARLFTGQIA